MPHAVQRSTLGANGLRMSGRQSTVDAPEFSLQNHAKCGDVAMINLYFFPS